eukprot:1096613-Rhodomonas_salina.1
MQDDASLQSSDTHPRKRHHQISSHGVHTRLYAVRCLYLQSHAGYTMVYAFAASFWRVMFHLVKHAERQLGWS